ncbi:MAG: hypothetical protein LLG05_11355 [Porphyromonadaceae bacterium]|nr:hypothetical protein [Porphyromonadaceae bacterium]
MFKIISIALIFLCGNLMISFQNKIYAQVGGKVNIAKYAKVERDKNGITLQWEEPRDIYKVIVKTSHPSELLNNKIQYWNNNWPQKRVPKGEVDAGSLGWSAQDDWFNGEWKNADTRTEIKDNHVIYTFNAINAKEFPDENFDAVYRRSLKTRILFENNSVDIQEIEVYSNSEWKETDVKIEWGNDAAAKNWKGHFEIYNGELENIEALADNVTVEDQFNFRCDDKSASVKLRLRYTNDKDDPDSSDRTIVTLRSTGNSFSFSVDDVVSGEKIFVKDYDILVTKFADHINYAEFRQKWEVEHVTTLYDRIKELPEQTFENAKNDMPTKNDRGFIPLGCEGGRQKFGVDVNGDVFCPKNCIPHTNGKDSNRLLWEGPEIRHSFGFPNVRPMERSIENGYLPIIHNAWEADNIVYNQIAFVTLLGADISSRERMQGDDSTILLAKVTLTNSGNDSKIVNLCLKTQCDVEEKLDQKDGFVFATNYGPNRMRYFLDINGRGILNSEDGKLSYKINLAKYESHSIYFKIPFVTLIDDKEYELARNTDYDIEFSKVKKYWENRISEGTKIITPNETLNNFYRAHLTHMFITDDREVGSDRYASRVGTFPYVVYPNESCMCISDLDRRGYKREAEERLEMFLHYQSSVALPGNYTDKDGVFYGAGEYTEGNGYNQHHGWVLWALAEHYWYYRDKEWLKKVAPSMIKACNWIIRQRKNTMKYDKDGEKVLEYGFLPAGGLEDVHDYKYWLTTNAYTYWGFNNAAKALADINDPDGVRFVDEVKNYKEDLLRGYTESMIRSPVVKLRDGTYVPHVPPSLYSRGREVGWIREVLEGALHLIRCGILEPSNGISTDIIKDYEDNLYLSGQYGYTIKNFGQNWFSLGGFSMQSNLLCHPIPYILRDEPKHFLRGYFNAFTSTFYPDICALVEHALPSLSDNNGVWFKPSDEAQSTFWLRLMFVHENEDDLYLGQAIPRDWLADGNNIGIESAATYFGPLSFRIKSKSNQGQITAILDPPVRNSPKNIYVRFRHPYSRPIRSVTVNGKQYSNFDANKEWIILPGPVQGVQEIVAQY